MKFMNDKIQNLEKCVNDLDWDLKSINQEYERCIFDGSNEDVLEWFHSLPIETLFESINFELNKRDKYSLIDMKRQFLLRKLHKDKLNEIQVKNTELYIAKIDNILGTIESIV